MDLLKWVFGGSESETKLRKESIYTPEQEQALKQFTETFANFGPAPKAPGMSVDRTPEEQSFFDWAGGLVKSRAMQTMRSGEVPYEVGPEFAEQFFEESVKPAYMKEFEDVTIPGIRSAYAGPGYYGSARMGAEGKASSDLGMQLASKRAELLYGEEIAKRGAIESAYGRVLGAEEATGEATGRAGELSRTIAQERVMEQLNRFLMGEEVEGEYQPAYNPNVNLVLSLLGISPYTFGTETKTESTPGILGAARDIAKAVT